MDLIYESYLSSIELNEDSESWNIFKLYADSPAQKREAMTVTKKIIGEILNHKIIDGPQSLSKKINTIILNAENVGATDTKSKNLIYEYLKQATEGFADEVFKHI